MLRLLSCTGNAIASQRSETVRKRPFSLESLDKMAQAD
jgi:hypothetical protein